VIVVSDSGPLIYLSQLGLLDLLHESFGQVHVPQQVYDEVVVAGGSLPGSSEVKAAAGSWLQVIAVDVPAVESDVVPITLDAGERAAIRLLLELKGERLLCDDRRGRNAAAELGFQVVGTAGILLSAKFRGRITRLRPLLDQLTNAGFRLSEHVYLDVIERAGESEDVL